MKKISHVLKDNKSNRMPQRLIFFDTETVEQKLNSTETKHVLRLGEALYWRRRQEPEKDTLEWFDFTTVTEFWPWVFDKVHDGERLFLVAHNVSFDFKVLSGFTAMKQASYEVHKVIINGTTNIWEFKQGKRSIIVLDNMNFFKSSLSALGKDLGLEKLPFPATAADAETWRVYCRRDVEVMHLAWIKWIEFMTVNDLGCFAKTVASQSLNAFRHRFMPTEIYIHAWDNISKIEREAYHGGRTEAFFIGRCPPDNYYYVDVNSMYPAVMAEGMYPVKLVGRFGKPSLKWTENKLKQFALIARVEVVTDEPVYPVVMNNRLVFPVGRFTTVLSSSELEYAFNQNHITRVEEALFYKKERIFERYVNFFYNARINYRQRGDSSFAYLCKLMLNSLYGKFGQRNEVYEKVGVDTSRPDGIIRELDYQSGRWNNYRIINGSVERLKGWEEGFNSFPALAAHITADARMKLYGYSQKAGRDNVFYCDTDSLFVNSVGFDNLKDNLKQGVLGSLSLVKQSPHLIINGLKDYVFGDDKVIKGIRKDAVKLDENTYQQIQFEGLRGALSRNRLDTMVTRTVTKHLNRKYSKAYVTNTGRVTPLDTDSHDSSI